MTEEKYQELLDKYGDDGEKYNTIIGDDMIMWEDVELIDEEKYKYKVRKIDKLYVLDEHIEHSYPADHIDYVYGSTGSRMRRIGRPACVLSGMSRVAPPGIDKPIC